MWIRLEWKLTISDILQFEVYKYKTEYLLLFILGWCLGPCVPSLGSEDRPHFLHTKHLHALDQAELEGGRKWQRMSCIMHPLNSSFGLWWLNLFHTYIKVTYPFIAKKVFSLLLILLDQDNLGKYSEEKLMVYKYLKTWLLSNFLYCQSCF